MVWFLGILLTSAGWRWSKFSRWNKSESVLLWFSLCWPKSCKSCRWRQTLLWVTIHAHSTVILICLTNLWRVCTSGWMSVRGWVWVIFLLYVCTCIWACARVTVPNHLNHTADVNNLWIKNYQKITPHNTAEIIWFSFGFGYAFPNPISKFVFICQNSFTCRARGRPHWWKLFPHCLGLYYTALLVLTGRLMSDGHSDTGYQQGFVLTLFSDVG